MLRPIALSFFALLGLGGMSANASAHVLAPRTKISLIAHTAVDVARMLQAQMLSGAGVNMKFSIKGGEHVNVTADLKSKRVRIDSKSMLIVSDGATVWNYQKKGKQVTIDQLGKGVSSRSRGNSVMQDPNQLFKFAENYTARLVASKGKNYTLELTPNNSIQGTLAAAGGIKTITFNVTLEGKTLKIRSASAVGSQGKTETGAFSVQSLKAVSNKDFAFTPPKGVRVIDLRD